ncbi:hypothetical protein AM500_21305 [Bacillus sp. FJAT-18017]|uniref:hypothetical protein n=1 Tax=Bacillus sp. FJAT-18017 TaxID=1705566 RepID=UPI0006B05E51|nr:hypothetical protein [Bacillus sp. FJAT-18017]ALC92047.1 hypothetical protein AM500_21305 [Bacillus sp. FJAT-18017]
MSKKLMVTGIILSSLIFAGCSKENPEQAAAEEKPKAGQEQTEGKSQDFNPEEFVKEAGKHGMEWYIAEVAKLKPEEISQLEEYQKELEAKKLATYEEILKGAETKEATNDEGQKVIEYKMVNKFDHDFQFFQLAWTEGDGENYSQTADNVRAGQPFTLIVDPAFDKTLNDIDLSTLSLTGSE